MKHQKIIKTILTACVIQFSLVGCAPGLEGNSEKTTDSYEVTESETSEPESATSKPEPATTEPESATSKPEPATSEPEPATSEPEPATSEPEPATSEPEPATSEPEPATSEPGLATSKPESATVTAEKLIGPWHLAENEKDNSTAIEAIPGTMEFGSSMEITGDGHLSWYIGADGGSGTYSLNGNVLSADMTNDFDGSPMKMEFTAEETDGIIYLYTEYKGLLLCWSQGEGETGKGQEPESEESYPGADVVELVNLRGDKTTVYKLADGTYMDRIERRFTYNGTDTWTDEDGVEWNEAVE